MQGPFRAVKIRTDEQLIHLSRYIHLNPLIANIVKSLEDYQWSSFKNYVMKSDSGLCDDKIVIKHFRSQSDYKKFVLDQINYARGLKKLAGLTIEK